MALLDVAILAALQLMATLVLGWHVVAIRRDLAALRAWLAAVDTDPKVPIKDIVEEYAGVGLKLSDDDKLWARES